MAARTPGELPCSAKSRVCPDLELFFWEGDADGDGAKLSEVVTPCGPPALPGPPDIVKAQCPQQERGFLAVLMPGAAKPEQCHLADLQRSAC